MRALCNDLNGPFPGYDVVFLARQSATTADYSNMIANLRKALVKAAVISS